jgi:penicillin-binding protein 1B
MALDFSRRNLIRTGLIALALLFSVLLTIAAIKIGTLDKEIRTRFSSVRWALPAQVYAAPQELYPGLNLPLDEFQHELLRLGYRPVEALEGPGTFVAHPGAVDVATRNFAFWDGAQQGQRMVVRGDKDSIESISNLASGKALELVRLDPMLIGSIYPSRGGEDRVLIQLKDAPELLSKGLLAVEDHGFYEHGGISIRGIARAMFANIVAGHTKQGASTITQQLVKNFFLTSERSFKRKFKEIIMSVLIESHYSKDEILEAYLNEIYMGQDGDRAVHGFGLASSFYFNKPLQELKPHEMALLVGIVKGPSQFDPRRRPDMVRQRRDLVLKIWADAGLLRADIQPL